MKTKRAKRAAFRAWENLVLVQIRSFDTSIKALESEIKATRRLRACVKNALALGRDQEGKMKP